MRYLEKREYRIQPDFGYRIRRGCSGCGGRSVYAGTGNFRVNANGRQIDVWLIYQCEKCGHTYNLAVYERVAPRDIPPEEYRRFLENDKAAALWWGTRKETFAKNRADKAVAEICRITRSRVRQLLKEGKIRLAQNYVGRKAEIELPENLGF